MIGATQPEAHCTARLSKKGLFPSYRAYLRFAEPVTPGSLSASAGIGATPSRAPDGCADIRRQG